MFCRVQIPTWLPGLPALLLAASPSSQLLPSFRPVTVAFPLPITRQPECRHGGATVVGHAAWEASSPPVEETNVL